MGLVELGRASLRLSLPASHLLRYSWCSRLVEERPLLDQPAVAGPASFPWRSLPVPVALLSETSRAVSGGALALVLRPEPTSGSST